MYRPVSRRTLAIGCILSILAWTFSYADRALAEHSVALEETNTIPSYCQESNILCGAAVGQMILEGYPNGIEHSFPQQCSSGACVWAKIVENRDDAGADWATDPDGLWQTLQQLGNDPGVNWQIFAPEVAESLMFSIAYWMTKRRFPTAILVDNGPNIPGVSSDGSFNHWVVITRFTTDVDPTSAGRTSVNLESIDFIDPLPTCASSYTEGGTPSHITGAAWYTHYLDAKGNLEGSKWNGKYVGIIEPPIQKGLAKATRLPTKGQVIEPNAARDAVVAWLGKFDFKARPFFAVLRGTVPLEPLLVNADSYGYYLFPLGYERGQIVQGAILINAYNGAFEQIGVFPKQIQYLDKLRAIQIAVGHLCACNADARAQLVYYGSAQAQSRYMPLWKVTLKNGAVVYVDQQERVFTQLTPLPAGD